MASRSKVGEAPSSPRRRKPSCPPEDVALLERLRRNDPEAMRIVVDCNWLTVYRRVRRMVGNRHTAEDVVQETLIRFWSRRTKWQPRRPIRSILLRVASNLSRDVLRARRTRSDSTASWPRPLWPEQPDAALERQELKDAVWAAIEELPERQRQALVLVHFEGCSYQEVADKMTVSLQTVANHLTAARRKLRQALEAYADYLN